MADDGEMVSPQGPVIQWTRPTPKTHKCQHGCNHGVWTYQTEHKVPDGVMLYGCGLSFLVFSCTELCSWHLTGTTLWAYISWWLTMPCISWQTHTHTHTQIHTYSHLRIHKATKLMVPFSKIPREFFHRHTLTQAQTHTHTLTELQSAYFCLFQILKALLLWVHQSQCGILNSKTGCSWYFLY